MSSFRKSFGSGLFYTALSKYSNVFISLGIGAVLARLLSPEEFGIVAILTVFTIFFGMLGDFGIGPAVIQNNDLTNDDIRSIFSFTIIFGLILGIIFYLISPNLANYYNEVELINLGRLLSISVFINTLTIVPKALIRKKLLFKKLGLFNVLVNLIGGIIAVILAYQGYSYYALVFRSISDGLVALLIYLYLAPVTPSIFIKMRSLRKIARFSSYQLLFNFVNYFSRNLDNILIGKYLSPALLGFYDRSYKLMKLPVQNLTHIFTPVMPAIFASVNNDKIKIFNSYKNITKALALIGFPLSVYLYFTATEIISIIYGNQWAESITVFKILAFSVGIQIVTSSTGAIFQSTLRTDLLFVSGLLNSFVMATAILYGIFVGKSIESVGFGLLIAFYINFFIVFIFLIKYSLESSFITFLKNFIEPLIISVLLFFSMYAFSKVELGNLGLAFVSKTALALGTFVPAFWMFKSNRELFNLIINRKRK